MRSRRGYRLAEVQGAGFVLACVLGVCLMVAAVAGGVWTATVENTETGCTVTGKDRAGNNSGQADMRVYTEECGTFVVADSIVKGRWNSADTYARIQQGERYTFRTAGIRAPFLSLFPNILEVTPA